jgi:hypothetical protein
MERFIGGVLAIGVIASERSERGNLKLSCKYEIASVAAMRLLRNDTGNK